MAVYFIQLFKNSQYQSDIQSLEAEKELMAANNASLKEVSVHSLVLYPKSCVL